MKKYLMGFGVIMAVGLAFALSGSNIASSMLATILDVSTVNTTTTATATNIASTTTATGSTGTVRTALLSGLTDGQVIQGAQVLAVYANGDPISAKFIVTNIQTNVSSSIDATCTVDTTTQTLAGKCVGEMGTLTMANGKYTIVAHVIYSDQATVSSNQVAVYIYNTAPKFSFASVGSPISGMISIGGEISAATAVEFLYAPSGSTQTVRIGSGIYSGGTTASKWAYEWDTKMVPNGSYVVIANVTSRYNNGVAYHAGEMPIKVFNEALSIEPVVNSVPTSEEPITSMNATDSAPTAKSSIEPTTGFGMTAPESIATPISPRDQNSEVQNNAQPQSSQTIQVPAPEVPVPPVVQRIQDIAIGLQSGSDTASVERKVAALQKELWGNVDPANPVVQAKMQYQSAKQFGTTVDTTVMRVAEVALATTTEETTVSVATTTASGKTVILKEKKQIVKEKIRLAGKALPNMYVTLYVYSEIPTIAVVKADRNGNWVYELDNRLADGRHEAYVTINDRTGKIVAKSTLFGFVKTAEAITPENVGLANIKGLSNEPIQPVEAAKRTYGLIAFAIIGGGLLIGILLVIHSFRSKKQDLI